MLIEECSARIQRKLPPKLKDPVSFTVPYTIGNCHFDKALCDLSTIDFLILDVEEDKDVPLILGRPFLATRRAIVNVQKGQLILRLGEEQISFNVFKAMKFPTESDGCFQIDVIDRIIQDTFRPHHPSNTYEACIAHSQSTHTDSNAGETSRALALLFSGWVLRV
ncbi:uncharacterized protein LOC111393083 [Olea europaea var. sylvestris]|uniref:uncharacterized protein LOC111393083 n=1 Tax=Olea europaea var. sylvestris TaxID=158386 RepID=UPI000C1CF3B7|nr:uncharacterized protein LOC111393083 [Olea europaea var. sylvestris]